MKRVVTALVGLPLVVAAVFLTGPPLFRAIAVALVIVALWEYLTLCGISGTLFVVALLAGGVAVGTASPASGGAAGGLPLLLLVVASLWGTTELSDRFRFLAEASFGVMYLSYAFACLILLRSLPQGASWTMIILGIMWAGDTAAYYGGRRFGGPKMAPRLSPKKTWSGSVSGLAGSVAAAVTLAALLPVTFPLGKTALLALVVGIAGQLGDLVVSLWKRAKGVKDSGRIIPGHGGLLDRTDSLLLGFPVGYALILNWIL